MKKGKSPARAYWNALQNDDAQAAAKFVAAGADPNEPWPLGKASAYYGLLSPLFYAASVNLEATARMLLKHGADPDGGNRWMTPLAEAALHRHDRIVKVLKKAGARSTLFTSVALDDAAGVRMALKQTPDAIAQRDEIGNTPLHYAARRLSPAMVKLLLDKGADARAANVLEKTVLHAACDVRAADPKAQLAVLKLLLKHGADVNAEDRRKVRPLHVAVRGRNLAAAKFLLEHGAEADAADDGRSTPLRRAVANTGAGGTKGRQEEALALVRLLLKHGANPKAKDRRGRTVLQAAQGKETKALLAGR